MHEIAKQFCCSEKKKTHANVVIASDVVECTVGVYPCFHDIWWTVAIGIPWGGKTIGQSQTKTHQHINMEMNGWMVKYGADTMPIPQDTVIRLPNWSQTFNCRWNRWNNKIIVLQTQPGSITHWQINIAYGVRTAERAERPPNYSIIFCDLQRFSRLN